MSILNPMPQVVENQNRADQEENRGNDEIRQSDESEHLAIETKTTSKTHCINWVIDFRSLHIAQLAAKGDKRGVIEANVEKEGHKFKLELCASGWRNSQDGYCAFYLTVQDQDELFVARYRVQVGTISRISSIRHDFHLGVGFPNFCEQSQLEQFMTNSSVRFMVTVEIFSCKSKVQVPNKPLVINGLISPQEVLSKLMKEMLQNRLHTDVDLLCQSYRIPIHKCVLAHASPVFRAIFSHNFVENSTSQICMHEWKPEIVELMVIFLYTARIEDSNEIKQKFSASSNQRCLAVETNDESDDVSQSYDTGFDNRQGLITASPSPSESYHPDIESTISISPNFINLPQLSDLYLQTNEIINNPPEDLEMKLNNSYGNEFNETISNNSRHIPKSLECRDEEKEYEEIIIAHNQPVNVNNVIFCGDKCENYALSQHTTFDLFQLAEYYKIEALVIACCQKMHEELKNETACDLLVRIERYLHVPEIRVIKESIWQFVTDNIREIKQTCGYSNLVKYNPDLLGQLIDQMTK